MPVVSRVVKATTRKGKKVLMRKEPQVIEGPKRVLFFQGRKSSDVLRGISKDLYNLKKPDALMLSRKHDVTIFENPEPVEFFCRKHETPLFVMSSHSKKRPDNLVVGRMYNNELLDMVELQVDSYTAMAEFVNSKILVGTKPLLVFSGHGWDETEELKTLKSIFIDMFNREQVERIRLNGFEHTMSFTVTPDHKILIRSYKMLLKKSGETAPYVDLDEIGPKLELSLRRSKLPSEDLMKEALRKPKELEVGTKKNISTDELGNTHGRVHVGKQQIDTIQVRKMKGLRKTVTERKIYRREKSRRQSTDANPDQQMFLIKKKNAGEKASQGKSTSPATGRKRVSGSVNNNNTKKRRAQ